MASSRLPNGLVNRAQVLDCIYTYGLFVAQPCLAPMDFARRLLHISTASGALRLRRFVADGPTCLPLNQIICAIDDG
jgi:hypothetical protein